VAVSPKVTATVLHLTSAHFSSRRHHPRTRAEYTRRRHSSWRRKSSRICILLTSPLPSLTACKLLSFLTIASCTHSTWFTDKRSFTVKLNVYPTPSFEASIMSTNTRLLALVNKGRSPFWLRIHMTLIGTLASLSAWLLLALKMKHVAILLQGIGRNRGDSLDL
jgi:hypothetical protein